MKLKLFSVVVVLAAMFALGVCEMKAQADASVIWIKVYGQPPAVANMTFGARIGNSIGLDTASSFPDEYREQEPPPPSPGFDAVWAKIRATQDWGSFRGLLDKDFHGWTSSSQKDTFKINFSQNDNSSADISMKWPDPTYLGQHCTAMRMRYFDPNSGFVFVDMFTQDSINFAAAGDNGINNVFIYVDGLTTVETGVRLDDPTVPSMFRLNQNYPNPFNPTTTMKFDIQKLSFAEIAVYNILGQKVATLVSSQLSPGVYSTVWNGTNDAGTALSSGMYFARMNARVEGTGESFTALRKLLLMK